MASVDESDPGSLPLVDPDAPATIIFTSGTTGAAKGIVYTHRQIVMATASILRTFADIEPGSRMACWLPLSNLFQRMLNFCAIARGAQIYYVGQPQEIMRHVVAIRPDVFIGVPRFYEKLHAGIVDQIDADAGAATARSALGSSRRLAIPERSALGSRCRHRAAVDACAGGSAGAATDSRRDGRQPAVHDQRFGPDAPLVARAVRGDWLAGVRSVRIERERDPGRGEQPGSAPPRHRRPRDAGQRGQAGRGRRVVGAWPRRVHGVSGRRSGLARHRRGRLSGDRRLRDRSMRTDSSP